MTENSSNDKLMNDENQLDKKKYENSQKNLNINDEMLLEKIIDNEVKPIRFNQDEKWGYKVKNHIIIDAKYASASPFKYGVAVVKDFERSDHLWIIDIYGNIIFGLYLVKKIDISLFNGMYLKLKIEYYRDKPNLVKIVDFDGNLLFDEVGSFIRGKAVAKKNEKWGLIDEKGNELTSFEYDYIGDFIDGKALISKQDNEWYSYREIEDKSEYRWGCIDEKGNELIPCEYDYIDEFIDGKAKTAKIIRYYKTYATSYIFIRAWGYIDKDRKSVV